MSTTTLNDKYAAQHPERETATCYGCSKEIFHNGQINVWVHEETHSAVCGTRAQLNAVLALDTDDPARHLRYATPCLHCLTGDCNHHN